MGALAAAPSLFDQLERHATLDARIVATWTSLAGAGVAGCPLCGGELAREAGGDGEEMVAACGECRTEID